jgi:MoxR-like ATPase
MSFENPKPDSTFLSSVNQINEELHSTIDEIEKVIKGKREVVENLIIGLSANGHVLLKDVPGVGKTMLAKTLAKGIESNYDRIQFTPDLLPSDITGVSIFNDKTREFEFQIGPVFTNVLLADEINRASPKTQSALLEAMEERQVSVDGKTYLMEDLFFVIATKNPIEQSGTYPLPSAQLDRFMMQLSIGYPDTETEVEILQTHGESDLLLAQEENVVTTEQVLKWREIAKQIYTSPIIDKYIVNLSRQTREDSPSGYGVSPRASLQLKFASKACAMLHNRDYIIPEDVQRMVRVVFPHRMSLRGKASSTVIEELIEKVEIQ